VPRRLLKQKQSDNHDQDETYCASTALRGQATWDRFWATPTLQFPARWHAVGSSSGRPVPLVKGVMPRAIARMVEKGPSCARNER
jgi:hypothetical protein